jgi:TPP-dependent trihydroxycyclohexane-1,2-dione (THcHDO) dehydratase
MTYLVVGLDQSTFAPWHQNVGAADATMARQIAFARAQARGIELVIAAVIGPGCTVMVDPVAGPVALARAA